MDKIVEHLHTVESVAKRLEALAAARGCPKNVSERCLDESKTLKWAFKELKNIHFADVLCIVGTHDYISLIPDIEISSTPINAEGVGDLAVFLEFKPDPLRVEKIKEFLIGDSAWPGNKLPPEKMPPFLYCERYFACGQAEDQSKRAVMMNCIISKEYLEEKGLGVARTDLSNWLQKMFLSMKWSDAKNV